jgi:hypothetical protein
LVEKITHRKSKDKKEPEPPLPPGISKGRG